mgnify:CR=1 FL=1
MIAGIGTDIAAVARLGKLYERHGERALEKILAPAERDAFTRAADPARFLAKRFAAKEALGKALEGYTLGKPWLVVSDGFPAGCLPRPTLPQIFEPERKIDERKAAKKKHWLPAVRSTEPMRKLLADGLQTDRKRKRLQRAAVDERLWGDVGDAGG